MPMYAVTNPLLRGIYDTVAEALDVACRFETLEHRMRPFQRGGIPAHHAAVSICELNGSCENYACCYATRDGIEIVHQYEWEDGRQTERRPLADLSVWGLEPALVPEQEETANAAESR